MFVTGRLGVTAWIASLVVVAPSAQANASEPPPGLIDGLAAEVTRTVGETSNAVAVTTQQATIPVASPHEPARQAIAAKPVRHTARAIEAVTTGSRSASSQAPTVTAPTHDTAPAAKPTLDRVAEEASAALKPAVDRLADKTSSATGRPTDEPGSALAPAVNRLADHSGSALAPAVNRVADRAGSALAPAVNRLADQSGAALAPAVNRVADQSASVLAPAVNRLAGQAGSALDSVVARVRPGLRPALGGIGAAVGALLGGASTTVSAVDRLLGDGATTIDETGVAVGGTVDATLGRPPDGALLPDVPWPPLATPTAAGAPAPGAVPPADGGSRPSPIERLALNQAAGMAPATPDSRRVIAPRTESTAAAARAVPTPEPATTAGGSAGLVPAAASAAAASAASALAILVAGALLAPFLLARLAALSARPPRLDFVALLDRPG